MTTAKPTVAGPVGRQVIANIERLRKERRLSFQDLSERLSEVGRPILANVLHRQSQGQRRVDSDDLTAFAEVFGVSVTALLAPTAAAMAEDHQAVRAARQLADRLAAVITADSPEDAERARLRAGIAMRRVALEAEELFAAVTVPRGTP